jgi:hypothetical protein
LPKICLQKSIVKGLLNKKKVKVVLKEQKILIKY